MTQLINDKLNKCCEQCQSLLDKPCAWLSLGNEYCDPIMEVNEEINKKEAMYDSLAVDYRLAQEEIERLKNKLLRIEKLIDRTPRQTSKEIAYIMLKAEIAEVIGVDKK